MSYCMFRWELFDDSVQIPKHAVKIGNLLGVHSKQDRLSGSIKRYEKQDKNKQASAESNRKTKPIVFDAEKHLIICCTAEHFFHHHLQSLYDNDVKSEETWISSTRCKILINCSDKNVDDSAGYDFVI
ncbi:unnamed protein product [Didymodactylos carnosus]|uniref:Uncharacterized protein n=1 Tax=Didymodactylos carnosus TaxID=1234261 RepID=A0A814MWY2_9BILA|nr:unnamed protein product [Didymodactylos carnosus]CAF1084197.1 unnamed protein product [Didymodactylos carnosus]CAF3612615.1 unnamed protein product [Didymodactylos carnosus]CAF3849801.1 unnamed protein product [Didymodactylos carnosus]